MGALEGNLALWFLFSLFSVKIIFTVLYNRKVNVSLVMSGAYFLALIQYLLNNPLPEYCRNICSGLFFYVAGYLLVKYQKRKSTFVYSAIILCIMLLIGIPSVAMRSNALLEGNYLLWYVYSVAGCLFINKLMTYIPYKKILKWIGRNSMPIYITHWLIIKLFELSVGILNIELTKMQRFSVLLAVIVITEPVIVWMLKSTCLKILMQRKCK